MVFFNYNVTNYDVIWLYNIPIFHIGSTLDIFFHPHRWK